MNGCSKQVVQSRLQSCSALLGWLAAMRRTRGAAACARAVALACVLAAAAGHMASAASPTASTAPEDVALMAWIAERGGDLGAEIRRPAGGPRGVFAIRDHEGAAQRRAARARAPMRYMCNLASSTRSRTLRAAAASLRHTSGGPHRLPAVHRRGAGGPLRVVGGCWQAVALRCGPNLPVLRQRASRCCSTRGAWLLLPCACVAR
jgi:hypothetical protein